MKCITRVCLLSLLMGLSACTQTPNLSPSKSAKSVTEKPYLDRGKCYVPQTRYDYCKCGYASWYGTKFHGRPTSTGIVFNKHLMTAAHRTLPLPCVVEITNNSNGRKLKVLVNDRGPFAKIDKRIIDLSERAATVLGFHRQGVANVTVKCLPYESMLAALYYGKRPYIGTYRALTKKEFKYIKEEILRDKSLHCESLIKVRKRNINAKNIRNGRNKGNSKRRYVNYQVPGKTRTCNYR